jgi:hypothetical protein
MSLYQKLDYNAKNESPYLVTNLPTIFRRWDLAFKNMIKGIASILFHSTACYSYLCLISLPIPHIKTLMLQRKKKSRNTTKAQTCKSKSQLENIRTT